MTFIVDILARSGLLKQDVAYHLLRASMVLIFLLFGYQKWFQYEAEVLIPFIKNGPLIFWLYPAFGVRGGSIFLGLCEWTFGALIFAGFWNKSLGLLGALGSVATFTGTVTIIPFMPNGWAESAGGFPAMVGNVPFLMKDVVLLAVSIYLVREDVQRLREAAPVALTPSTSRQGVDSALTPDANPRHRGVVMSTHHRNRSPIRSARRAFAVTGPIIVVMACLTVSAGKSCAECPTSEGAEDQVPSGLIKAPYTLSNGVTLPPPGSALGKRAHRRKVDQRIDEQINRMICRNCD